MSRLVRKIDAFYYHDGKTWYRVYDGYFQAGRHHRFKPGSSRQPNRYFVPKDPSTLRRLYKFEANDNRQVTRALLDAQFEKAAYFAGPKRTDDHMRDWRADIMPDTPEKVAAIRKRNKEKGGGGPERKRRTK